jgi:hypothetical protein
MRWSTAAAEGVTLGSSIASSSFWLNAFTIGLGATGGRGSDFRSRSGNSARLGWWN